MEAVLSSIIPSETNVINSLQGTSYNSSYQLTLTNYTPQIIPYYLNGSSSSFQTLLNERYSVSNGITLNNLSNNTVNNYVLGLRKLDLNYLLYFYFEGVSINSTAPQSLVFYWSSMAFHSSANMLNDIDNFFYNFITNDPTKNITTINKPISASSSLDSSTSYLEVLGCIDVLPLSLLNFLNGIIVALMIGLMVVHVGRERVNGSKQLQYLSGTHYLTYWFSNYLFDLVIYLFNISTMVIALKIVNAAKNDPTNELYAIASDNTLGYLYLLLLISSFAWCTYAYIWSFIFNSEIIGFVILAIFLGFMAFLDVVWTFLQLLIVNGGSSTPASNFIYAIRIIFALLFPNVTVKRGMYDLKIKSNNYCVEAVNQYLGGIIRILK